MTKRRVRTTLSHSIQKSDSHLRTLLEILFDSSECYVFEDVLFQFARCITFDLNCLFYIKERRWFSDAGVAPTNEYLKFNYLAFELQDGRIPRFPTLKELLQRETEFTSFPGYKREESRLCTMIYNSSAQARDLRRIVNLTKRIFAAFYKNCGAHDHFLESVSRRFIREFYAMHQSNRSLAIVAQYINQKCQMDVSIWNQKDEMYFHQTADPSGLLTHVTSTDDTHKNLFQDLGFQAGLKTSVTRKNQTYGKCVGLDTYYVIRTFSDSYFIGETGHSNFKTQQKAVAIYSTKRTPISIDGVWHANRLIDTVLRTTQETQYHSIILGASQNCALREEELSTFPVATKEALIDEFQKLLNPLLSDVANHTRAEFACMRLYEPFSNSLVPVACASAEGIPIANPVGILATAEDLFFISEVFLARQNNR
jgi:hypothetical protein